MEKSELNDVLRSAGIYTGMILREERAQITDSRNVELDEGQTELLYYLIVNIKGFKARIRRRLISISGSLIFIYGLAASVAARDRV